MKSPRFWRLMFSRAVGSRGTPPTLASSLGRMLGAENVDVLCFFDWGHSGETPTEFRVAGMVSNRGRAGMLSRLQFLFKAAGAGTKGYDLVIANHVALAPVAALMKLVFRTPYWVACHSVEIWWGTSRLRHAALKNADLILPVSRYTADVVKKMDGIEGSRVKVVYNAIPDSFAKSVLSEGPPGDSTKSSASASPVSVHSGSRQRVQGRGHGDPRRCRRS